MPCPQVLSLYSNCGRCVMSCLPACSLFSNNDSWVRPRLPPCALFSNDGSWVWPRLPTCSLFSNDARFCHFFKLLVKVVIILPSEIQYEYSRHASIPLSDTQRVFFYINLVLLIYVDLTFDSYDYLMCSKWLICCFEVQTYKTNNWTILWLSGHK
jgi:hypothetical protein